MGASTSALHVEVRTKPYAPTIMPGETHVVVHEGVLQREQWKQMVFDMNGGAVIEEAVVTPGELTGAGAYKQLKEYYRTYIPLVWTPMRKLVLGDTTGMSRTALEKFYWRLGKLLFLARVCVDVEDPSYTPIPDLAVRHVRLFQNFDTVAHFLVCKSTLEDEPMLPPDVAAISAHHAVGAEVSAVQITRLGITFAFAYGDDGEGRTLHMAACNTGDHQRDFDTVKEHILATAKAHVVDIRVIDENPDLYTHVLLLLYGRMYEMAWQSEDDEAQEVYLETYTDDLPDNDPDTGLEHPEYDFMPRNPQLV